MAQVSILTTDLSVARLGKPLGFASLGADGKVPAAQLPTGLVDGLVFQGLYNASSNTPDLTLEGNQVAGHLYVVSVAGTQDIGNGSEDFFADDSIFWSGDEWYHIQGKVIATEVEYSNGTSGLLATDVQGAIDEVAGLASAPPAGSPYVAINSTGLVPTAQGTDSIVIGEAATDSAGSADVTLVGKQASSFADDVVGIGTAVVCNDIGSVGIGHTAAAFGVDAISIGKNSTTFAPSAVQIGAGSNSTASTLQFLTVRLANAQGLYTSHTSPTNYFPADTDNVTSHLTAIDSALGSISVGTPVDFQTNREDVAVTPKNLANGDKGIQHLKNTSGSTVVINLPGSPTTDKRFLIKCRTDSVDDFTIAGQGATLTAGDIWEAVYDGVEWIVI